MGVGQVPQLQGRLNQGKGRGQNPSPFTHTNKKGDTAMNIPTILESLAKDIENGGTWEEAAWELHKAGWSPYVDVEKAKRLVTPYLNKAS